MILTSDKNRYLTIVIIIASLCLLETGWLILPMIKKIYNKNKIISTQKEEMFKLLKAGQSVKENEKNLVKIRQSSYLFDHSWLKSGDELKFITDLEKIARDNKVQQIITFDNTNFKLLKKGIKIIPVELRLNTELTNFMHYIIEIEQLDYYINFKNIKISLNSDKNSRLNPHQLNIAGDNSNIIQKEKNNLIIQLKGETYWK